jgi:16S rRNA A1518/A1519 N6-dimethyltransferase RsmA/KsgA/DIM1 with predicted DNA glycosylase/AP lyase activity
MQSNTRCSNNILYSSLPYHIVDPLVFDLHNDCIAAALRGVERPDAGEF